MKIESSNTISVWAATTDIQPRPQLMVDTTADVCVVGSVIAGLTTAYLLANEVRSVVVLDEGSGVGRESTRTTAHLTHALDDRYFEIERIHGPMGARMAAESHTTAINRMEA